MMRILGFATLGVLLPILAAAQQPSNRLTYIPGKGMLVHPAGQGSAGTFIPNARLSIPGSPTLPQVGDYCSWCQCCNQTDRGRVVDMLNHLNRQDIASDPAMSQAVDIDLSRVPRR